MNRHIIIRAVMAVLWIGVGIFRMIQAGDVKGGLLSLAVGVAFGISAFTMLRKK
ncbi:MAG: hypothetical protein IJ555_03695 [Ruminococcus sp.]|nr:hypothetical protein [Ruminococcus sp.]